MVTTGTNSTTTLVVDGKAYRQCRRGCFHAEAKPDQWPTPEDWLAYLQHECDHEGETVVSTGQSGSPDEPELGYCACSASVVIVRANRVG